MLEISGKKAVVQVGSTIGAGIKLTSPRFLRGLPVSIPRPLGSRSLGLL